MSVVGSLIFCNDCGNLLPSVTDKDSTLDCSQCGQQYPSKDFANLKVVTKSAEDAFPSSLRMKRSEVKTVVAGDMEDEAMIDEECPQCGNPEMTYKTLQLRSADEGATVFYTCPKCGYKSRTNN